jgi:general L-amino acid transport system substrate-binding protein
LKYRLISAAIAVLLVFAGARDARAGEVLDHVRRDKIVRCSSAERPVVAIPRPDGGIGGIAVTMCRAVAIAVLGRTGRIAFTLDDARGDADILFVDATTPQDDPGPAIFVDRLAVLVPVTSRVHALSDLAGETVCLMIASPGQRALEAAVGHLGVDIVRLAFEEDDEMEDAYAVGRCGAMVGAETTLAGLRGPIGINRLTSRLVPEPLALVPIIAATGSADPDWTSLVFWVVNELTKDVMSPGESATAPPGLRTGWREDVSAILGDEPHDR